MTVESRPAVSVFANRSEGASSSADGPFAERSSTAGEPVPGDVPQSPHNFAYETFVITSFEELRDQADKWQDLADHAIEPNPFYEPTFLLPALAHLLHGARMHFLVVTAVDRAAPNLAKKWHGFFPFVRRRRYRGLPLSSLSLVHFDYVFLRTPLVRREICEDVLAHAFESLLEDAPARVVELGDQTADGPYHRELVEVLGTRKVNPWISGTISRALLRCRSDAEAFLRESINGRKIKELRRLEKRLIEMAPLTYRCGSPTEDPQPALAAFLELERQGWKGREGTAISQCPGHLEFFQEAMMGFHRLGRLRVLTLAQGDRYLAAKCNILAEPGSFAFKIAFDEGLAKYSPGVQLELDNIRRIHDEPGVRWMDSCADPNHPMINQLWRDRRILQTWVLPTKSRLSRVAVGMLPLLRGIKHSIR